MRRRRCDELKQLIARSWHEAPTSRAPRCQRRRRRQPCGSKADRLRGVIASRGLAVGRAVTLRSRGDSGRSKPGAASRTKAPSSSARGRKCGRGSSSLQQHSQAAAREVIAAHLEFLDDWELVAAARRAISRGKSAAFAWRRAVRDSADTLRALGDQRMAERVDDLLDLESQVLLALTGEAPVVVRDLPERAILIAEDLKPSQFVSLDATRLAGICLAGGGPTSHVAILAAAMGVPALVALGPAVLDVEEGAWLVLDAEHGQLAIAPDQAALAAAEQTLAAASSSASRPNARRRTWIAAPPTACASKCSRISARSPKRTSPLRMARRVAACCAPSSCSSSAIRRPTKRSSCGSIRASRTRSTGRPLIVRTLDIGGDKPIPYLPLPAEENPALGLRGVRTSLWRPDLLRVQLRAILRVQPAGQCRILLPMITDPAEITAVRRMLDEVRRELGAHGTGAASAR